MNCEIGDLAVIVRGKNLGALVEVTGASVHGPEYWMVNILGTPIKGTLFGKPVLMQAGNIEDSRLKPLRDKPGSDETLQWAPVPDLTPATV